MAKKNLRSLGTEVRFLASVSAAKAVRRGLRVSGKGGGTAAPGLIATIIDPMMLGRIANRLPEGAIVVAGTNGKTTTSRLLTDMLIADGLNVVNNRAGSNLVRGVAAELADDVSLTGVPQSDIAVIEADEAAFPDIVKMVQPRAVVLTNLFRDQLDRYGELNSIASRWSPVLQELPESAVVVVNVDDPRLAALTAGLTCRSIGFGLDAGVYKLDGLPHAADRARCRLCGSDLRYRELTVSHLGEWYCGHCGNERPCRAVVARDLELRGTVGSAFTLGFGDQVVEVETSLPGLYNAYNIAAAAAVSHDLGVKPNVIGETVQNFVAPFGRIDRIPIRGKNVVLILIKNPTGCNEVLRMLDSGSTPFNGQLLVVINDLDADGRDVSWLWDTDFELLERSTGDIATAGQRGADMANRLKYAGVVPDRISLLDGSLRNALYTFVDQIEEGQTGYVVATYTATIELRSVLADDGIVDHFWEQ